MKGLLIFITVTITFNHSIGQSKEEVRDCIIAILETPAVDSLIVPLNYRGENKLMIIGNGILGKLVYPFYAKEVTAYVNQASSFPYKIHIGELTEVLVLDYWLYFSNIYFEKEDFVFEFYSFSKEYEENQFYGFFIFQKIDDQWQIKKKWIIVGETELPTFD